MARKLRVVSKDEKVSITPRQLRAIQVFTFELAAGGEALGMVSVDGLIYLRHETGWTPFDMTEVPLNDPTV